MQKSSITRTLIQLLLLVFLTISCGKAGHHEKTVMSRKADSILFDAGVLKDYERILVLVDSFEAAGALSPLDANRWRGVAYYRQGQYRTSEKYYWKALEGKVETDEDQLNYNKVARRLSELLLVRGDYEGSLRVAIPAVKKMDQTGIGSDIDYAILLNNIGCCQLNLGQDKEANESFLTARGHYANRWQSDSTSRGFQEAVVGTVYTSLAYINMRRYAESIYWIDRTEMLLNMYRQRPDARSEYFDEYQGRIEIMRAVARQGLGEKEEAAQAYQNFLKTDYSKTGAGHINANDYLVAAHRYREAADNYRYLDQVLGDMGMEKTLDNIQLYMLPKYQSNAEAGRMDSALVAGKRILAVLDSAITIQKNSTTAEMATIYDTQGKEAEIAHQQTDLARQRLFSALIALGLVITFFSVFIFFRHRSAKRLEHAHEKLQQAYDKLEETTAAKERIESELRIARDIQMSMVPNIFPDQSGLDIYAVIEPAKEVGGDLYGYLLIGDKLYFTVGDVSGKGVPASLFMAQATRLFRTLASQGMEPAEIATRMNAALVEDNEQGMFVTMFLGLADLKTGHLEFCNAGHNPPLVKDEAGQWKFLDMVPNAPIGMWPGLQFKEEHVDSIKGMPLLIYSDGLNEAEDRQQVQFGDDRLIEVLSHTTYKNAKEVIDKLMAEVRLHRNGAVPNDDLTMMGLKIS